MEYLFFLVVIHTAIIQQHEKKRKQLRYYYYVVDMRRNRKMQSIWPSISPTPDLDRSQMLFTRAHFLGHLSLIATTGLSTVCNQKQAVTVDMSQSPDYGIWEALLKAHVKPTLIRGIPVNSVDYAGEAYEIYSCLSTKDSLPNGLLHYLLC